MTLLIAAALLLMPQAPPQVSFPKADLREQMSCAPLGLPAPPVAGVRVIGGPVHTRLMFGPGDELIVSAGTLQGVQKGQMFFVRRLITDPSISQPKEGALYGIHTAGVIKIVDAKETMAVATVSQACEGLLIGDYVEPYVEPVPPSAASALSGAPDYEHPARIMLADELRQTGYPGLVMLMNRGSDDGVRAGQTLTIYRETLNGLGPILQLGHGTVLSVNPRSAMMRIDSSRDALYVGDLVAIHRITQ